VTYEQYLQAKAPPWLQDKYGLAWMGGIGATVDDYVADYVSGTLAAFPGLGPADALGILGDELGLDRGPFETDQQYAARLAGAWIAWPYAGTPLGVLVALYWAGFGTGMVVVQQNGLAYTLSGTPVAGVDPRPLLTVTTALGLSSQITSNVSPPTVTQHGVANPSVGSAGRTIPVGEAFFASVDGDTDFCSRFFVYFPSLPFSLFRPVSAKATFTGTEDGVVPWPTASWALPFYDATTHKIIIGGKTPTDGGLAPPCTIVPGSRTAGALQLRAAAKWSGTVDVLGYGFTADDISRMSRAINKWRPAKGTCTGAHVALNGRVWGWPVQTWAQAMAAGPATFPKAEIVRYPV
jgi:hypothetical protein